MCTDKDDHVLECGSALPLWDVLEEAPARDISHYNRGRYSFARSKSAPIFARDASVTASDVIIARTSLRGTLIV